jgi:hypothetical protein
MEDTNISDNDVLADKVEININMLCVLMLTGLVVLTLTQ